MKLHREVGHIHPTLTNSLCSPQGSNPSTCLSPGAEQSQPCAHTQAVSCWKGCSSNYMFIKPTSSGGEASSGAGLHHSTAFWLLSFRGSGKPGYSEHPKGHRSVPLCKEAWLPLEKPTERSSFPFPSPWAAFPLCWHSIHTVTRIRNWSRLTPAFFFFFFLPWHHKARAAFLLPYILYNSAITVLFRLQNLALFCFSVIWPLFIIWFIHAG